MLASSWADPILGLDVHWEFVPTPAPVPTPIPNPFIGVVFDPAGLAVSLALSNAIGAVMGAPLKGPVLYWGMPATNTGTEGRHVPGHIIIPPGTSWAPIPKTPKPAIKGAPKPEKPVTPSNDAVVITGSKTVHVMGSNAARMGDLLLSCSEPVRLPSSVIVSVPKGAPILIGGPPALDLMAAIFASIRTRFIGDSLQAGISKLPIGARGRAVLSWISCKLTGHPVDVATGKVMTRFLDADLPGPLPLRIERFYMSNFAARPGPLGYGWSCSLDQAVWEERSKVVCLLEDGREIEFDTFDLPQRRMRVGDELWHPIDRLTLRREAGGRWRLTAADGVTREYGPLPGTPGDDGRARIMRIATRDECHEITFNYDLLGRLEWVRDSAGRLIRFEHDAQGRLVALKMPVPHERGWSIHRRYEYDAEGDLTRVVDAEGHAWSFEYVTHLLVRETDRAGLSFYFEYDGLGADAWCTRTWGDGGLFDHVISYDKQQHVTFVSDSLGHTMTYAMNDLGLVTRIVDPLGAEVEYTYDPRSLALTSQKDKLGRGLTIAYDDSGNVTAITYADGRRVDIRYEGIERPIYMRDAEGREWRQRFDATGHLVERVEPRGRVSRWQWSEGLVRRVESSDGSATTFQYEGKNVRVMRDDFGGETQFSWTALGQVRKVVDARGGTVTVDYDGEGRLIRMNGSVGPHLVVARDEEGNATAIETPRRNVRLRYGHRNRLIERQEAGVAHRFVYDTEGRLLAVVNPAGDEYRLTRDARGNVIRVVDFDTASCTYTRDTAGRVVRMTRGNGLVSTLEYDSSDRIVSIAHGDGTSLAFAYDPAGRVSRAATAETETLYEYDPAGRLVRELRKDADGTAFWVDSSYDHVGRRKRLQTSFGAVQALEHDRFGNVVALHHSMQIEPLPDTTITFEHDSLGVETSRLFPGALRLDRSLDAAGRTLERRLVASDGVSIAMERLTWLDERLASIESALEGPRLLQYDALDRLAGEITPSGTRERKLAPAVADMEGPRQRFGRGGRLVWDEGETIEYDGNGYISRRVAASGEEQRYHWNGAGQLTQVDLPGDRFVRFGYDAFGRRIRKSVIRRTGRAEIIERERRFFWDGRVVVHEFSAHEGLSTWHWEPGTFRPIAKQHGRDRYSVTCNVAGVPDRMVDEFGRTVWQAHPMIDGSARVDGDREACPWRGEGLYEDVETGLLYNHHRYFDPKLSRYVSKDPLGIRANADSYAWVDNPLTQSDPLGLATCGGEELPPNHAIISLSDTHASIRVVVEGTPGITTHQVLGDVPDDIMRRLRAQAAEVGPSAYNGKPTRVTSDPSGFRPDTQIMVPFPDADSARAAREAQMAARGSTRTGRNAGAFQAGRNSCVTHCNDVLQAGGVNSTHPTMQGYEDSLLELPGAGTIDD